MGVWLITKWGAIIDAAVKAAQARNVLPPPPLLSQVSDYEDEKEDEDDFS
jgi:hypothetical protein